MNRPLETILARLEHVRQYGGGYRAKCPAHGGKSDSSLSIKEVEDGQVLLRCFGGCETEQVLRAIGLSFKDLWPVNYQSYQNAPTSTPQDRAKARFYHAQRRLKNAVEVLHQEATVAWLAADQVFRRKPMAQADINRVQLAVDRIAQVGGELNEI